MNIWRLVTHRERGPEMVEWSRREGVIAIGWNKVGDLRNQALRHPDDLIKRVTDEYPKNEPANREHGGSSLWKLLMRLATGDLVILSTGKKRELTMRVTGDYYFVDAEPHLHAHRRAAEVSSIDPNQLWEVAREEAWNESRRSTLIRCARTLNDAECANLL